MTSAFAPSPWLPLADPPDARIRLVCCPHSGSGISPFVAWGRQLPAGVALCPVRYPGRETAMDRAPLRSVAALVDGILGALAGRPVLPTVLLGHSLGAAVAYDLARALQALGSPPALRVASGRQAPEHSLDIRLSDLTDAALVDEIGRR